MKIEEELRSSFRNDYQKLVVNLYLTFSRLHEPFHELLKSFDITPTQYNVLRILKGQKGNPASIGLIKERLIERNSDVSRIIARLYKKKLIDLKNNVLDKRQKDVVINDLGLDLLTRIEANSGFFDNQIKHISLEEVRMMNDLLDKLRGTETSTLE